MLGPVLWNLPDGRRPWPRRAPARRVRARRLLWRRATAYRRATCRRRVVAGYTCHGTRRTRHGCSVRERGHQLGSCPLTGFRGRLPRRFRAVLDTQPPASHSGAAVHRSRPSRTSLHQHNYLDLGEHPHKPARRHDRHCSRDHQRGQHHHHHDLEQPPTTPTPTRAPLTAATRRTVPVRNPGSRRG